MNQKQLLKSSNSKGKLATAVIFYQRALAHYANESHWAVKGTSDLIHAVGKLLSESTEAWRLEHPELLDAYSAAIEAPGDIVWLGDDDPTYAAALSLGQRKPDPKYAANKRPVTGQKINPPKEPHAKL